MAIPIPNVDPSHLNQDHKHRIDEDKNLPPCIWCRSGGKKKKHSLLDCPNSHPKKEQRTSFSTKVFDQGQQEYAIAYIHQLQRAHDPRQDEMTPFNSGKHRYQFSHLGDNPRAITTASTSMVVSAATTATTTTTADVPAVRQAPTTSVSEATATTINISGASNVARSTLVVPISVPSTTAVPSASTPNSTTLTATTNVPNQASNTATTDSAIRIEYEDENVQPLPPRDAPKVTDMQRGGRLIIPKPDTQQKLSAARDVATDFHPREKFLNTNGKVYTNHFRLILRPNQKLYKYRIQSTLPGKNRRKLRALMITLIKTHDFLRNHKPSFATDHFDTIIAWEPLHAWIGSQHRLIDGNGQTFPSTWQLQPDLLDGLSAIGTTFAFEGMVDVLSLVEHTEIDPDHASVDLEPTKRALNIIISKCFSESTTDMVQVGANKFFYKRGTKELKKSVALCAMRGYYYTVKAGVRNVLLNINPCTSAFFNNVRVSEVMNDTLAFNHWEWEGVLRGLRVRIELLRGDKNDTEAYKRLNSSEARVKTVQGLGLPLDQQEFSDSNDDCHIVYEHLRDTYPSRTLRFPRLPAVNLGSPSEPKWYAPEDLLIVPYQIYKNVVPTALTDSMLEAASSTPHEAAAKVDIEALRALGIPPSQTNIQTLVKCSAVDLDPQMLLVPSQTLGYPQIQYGNGAYPVNGSWNLNRKRFYHTRRGANFRTLVLVDNRVDMEVQGLAVRNIQAANVNYDVATLTLIRPERIIDPRDASAVEDVIRKHKPDLVLFIIGSRDVEAYSQFKDLCDRHIGCHSICMTRPLFNGGLPAKMANIMMKLNLKATGSNHTINNGKLAGIMADTLVLGADVTHPNGSSILGCPSIAAIVGSVDNHAGRFLGSMRLQSAGKKEMIDDVEGVVVERIMDWVTNNGFRFPKNIIYYRDGVSEGQYKSVRDEELNQITSAFPKALQELRQKHRGRIFHDVAPTLTAIVCVKRHHVRFYPEIEDMKVAKGNCAPGTCVDDVVTSPYYTDFYLQSHAPLHGTARPAHYFVLRNEMNKSTEDLRQLTHELCFTYVRTTGAVSYASPAYYADRLCERGRCYLLDFLVSTPHGRNLRQQLRIYKHEQEDLAAERRIAKYGPMRNADKTRRTKTTPEQLQELEDRNAVEEACHCDTMDKARFAFYTNGPDKNPWHSRVADTMFWM